LASEPRCQRKATTRPGGFGWNIGGIIVGKSADYDQEYSEYIFKKIGLVIKYSEYNHGIVGIIWHNWLGTI
jgi:hypothetical protein